MKESQVSLQKAGFFRQTSESLDAMRNDPSQITDTEIKAVCEGLELGLSESQSCRLEDILPKAFSDLKNSEPHIEHLIEQAKARRVKALLRKYNDEDLTSAKQKAIQNQLETTDPRFRAKDSDRKPIIDMSGMVLAPGKSERDEAEITQPKREISEHT